MQNTMTTGRIVSAIDDYMSVNSWSTVGIENFFAFAGGTGDAMNSNLKLGFAKTLGDNLLGVYFSGNLLSGNGTHDEPNADSFATQHTTTLNDNLAVLFGTPSIGAFRLDVLFDRTGFTASESENLVNGNRKTTSNAPFVTTLQWGTNIALGGMTLRPAVTVGYKWHNYSKTETKAAQQGTYTETVKEVWGEDTNNPLPGTGASMEDGAIYGKIAAPVKFENWTLSLDYAIEVGLDAKATTETKTYTAGVLTRTTTIEETRSGALWHEINLGASRSWEFTDQLKLGFKPNLKANLYSWSNKYTTASEQTDHATVGNTTTKTETDVQTGAFFAFELKPTLNLGLKYQWKPTVALYTGLGITLFDYQYLGKEAGKDWTEAHSAYNLVGMALAGSGGNGSLGIGLTIEPSEGFGIEIGITNQLLGLGQFGFDITQWSGVLAVRYAM